MFKIVLMDGEKRRGTSREKSVKKQGTVCVNAVYECKRCNILTCDFQYGVQ
jgi:hypothetical protein